LPRVFERFYQVDNTATRTYGGTGMGLALVRRLVEAHGGSVEVESRVGEGTRINLMWPRVLAPRSP
ncbi:MAG TPA: ATP-binding protein, partial [Candidatus Dormibacteraeota bacterium]|nr:ATP-binding protein [Candidatus Dormibacteraeota bacterium]